MDMIVPFNRNRNQNYLRGLMALGGSLATYGAGKIAKDSANALVNQVENKIANIAGSAISSVNNTAASLLGGAKRRSRARKQTSGGGGKRRKQGPSATISSGSRSSVMTYNTVPSNWNFQMNSTNMRMYGQAPHIDELGTGLRVGMEGYLRGTSQGITTNYGIYQSLIGSLMNPLQGVGQLPWSGAQNFDGPIGLGLTSICDNFRRFRFKYYELSFIPILQPAGSTTTGTIAISYMTDPTSAVTDYLPASTTGFSRLMSSNKTIVFSVGSPASCVFIDERNKRTQMSDLFYSDANHITATDANPWLDRAQGAIVGFFDSFSASGAGRTTHYVRYKAILDLYDSIDNYTVTLDGKVESKTTQCPTAKPSSELKVQDTDRRKGITCTIPSIGETDEDYTYVRSAPLPSGDRSAALPQHPVNCFCTSCTKA